MLRSTRPLALKAAVVTMLVSGVMVASGSTAMAATPAQSDVTVVESGQGKGDKGYGYKSYSYGYGYAYGGYKRYSSTYYPYPYYIYYPHYYSNDGYRGHDRSYGG